MLARLEHVKGNLNGSQKAGQIAEQLTDVVHGERCLSPRVSTWVKSCLVHLCLAQGNLERASLLLPERCQDEGEITDMWELEALCQGYILLARGDHESALTLSERLLPKAEKGKRTGRIIEILTLQALAFQGKKEMTQALEALGKALSLAQSEGYARTFLDEGEPMTRLLQQARTHQREAEYAAVLLSQIKRIPGGDQAAFQPLIEPLTLREIEVLKLIETGLSNLEIATQLVISLATVKRHISNIYTKLGVKNRTQTVSQARELRLL